ncbi:g7782 [Coccomyxa elongata]
MLDCQFRRPGVPRQVYTDYAWDSQFESNVERVRASMRTAAFSNKRAADSSAPNCMQQRSVGKAMEREDLQAIQDIAPAQSKLQTMTLLATQAQIAICAYGGSRAVKETSKQLYCLSTEDVSEQELKTVSGVSAAHVLYKFGQVFDTINGDKGMLTGGETRGPQFFVDDLFRKERVEECPLWRLCRYLRCRFQQPGLRFEDNLDSRESLHNFLDSPLYLTAKQNDFKNDKLRYYLQCIQEEAGVERMMGTGTHQLRHLCLKDNSINVNNPDKARIALGHAARSAHDVHYQNCQLPCLLDMVQKAGHLQGHIRVYRACLWASTVPEYAPLYHQISWISPQAEDRAQELSNRGKGLERWINANKRLADVLLQDLASAMGASKQAEARLMQETKHFAFLAPNHKLRPLWDKFRAHAAHMEEQMRSLDQPKVPVQLVDGSMMLVPADMKPFRREEPAKTAKTTKTSDIQLATWSHFVAHRNPLHIDGWISDIRQVYRKFAQPLHNVPFSLLEILTAQGTAFRDTWRGDFSKSFGWQSKVWAHVNRKRRELGMPEDVAVQSTQAELEQWRLGRGGKGGIVSWVTKTMTNERNPAVGEWWLVQ